MDASAGNSGTDSIDKVKKLPIIVILVSMAISGLIISGSLYLESHIELVQKYLPANNADAAEAVQNLMEPIVFAVFGVAIFLMIATVTNKVIKSFKETKRLETAGSRAYCRVDKVENKVYSDKSYTTEYRKISVTTPMGKVGVYDLPSTSPVKEGDSVLIMYDPSDADSYRMVFEKGDAVIKKKSA